MTRMTRRPQALDVVALLRDLPDFGLEKGQVGTVVDDAGATLLVEFSDADGEAFATPTLAAADLMVLRFEPVMV